MQPTLLILTLLLLVLDEFLLPIPWSLAYAALFLLPASSAAIFRPWKFWTVVLFFLFLPAFSREHGLHCDVPTFLVGCRVLARAVVLLAALNFLTAKVSVQQLVGALGKLGLGEVAFGLGLAINLLPLLRHSVLTTWTAFRLKGGLKRHRIGNLYLLARSILHNLVRTALETAEALEANGVELPQRPGRRS